MKNIPASVYLSLCFSLLSFVLSDHLDFNLLQLISLQKEAKTF